MRTEVAETVMPRPLSSPTIRLYPHCGFSSARRKISSRSERSSGGRPGFRCEYVHRRAISWRPAKQCVRLDWEDCPGRPGQGTAHRRQQRSISPGQLRPRGLPAEDRQLMAEDDDLQLLRATWASQQPHQREQVPDNEIRKRPEQDGPPSTTARALNLASRTLARGADEFANPTAFTAGLLILDRRLGLLATLLALLLAFARIYVGVHYPSDVAAGPRHRRRARRAPRPRAP